MAAVSWEDFARLASAPVTVSLRGRVWSADEPPERVIFAPLDYWRIEDDDGRLRYLANDDGFFQWRPAGSTVSCFQRREPGQWCSGGTVASSLIRPRDLIEPRDDDFTRPLGAVEKATFVGRPAWRVALAPPARKPQPVLQTVDVDTGVTLAYQTPDGTLIIGFTAIETRVDPPPETFAAG